MMTSDIDDPSPPWNDAPDDGETFADVEIEDGSAPEKAGTAAPEDEPELLGPDSRSIEAGTFNGADVAPLPTEPPALPGSAELDVPAEAIAPAEGIAPADDVMDRRPEFSARQIIAQLTEVETEVRQILENRDTRRKRKLAGTQRWFELQDDILSWRYSGRMDEQTLQRLQRLVMKRHHLFRQLHFVAGTRPTWNT